MIHFHMANSYHVKSLEPGYYPREEGVKNPEMTRKSLNLPEFIWVYLFCHVAKMRYQLQEYKESYVFAKWS